MKAMEFLMYYRKNTGVYLPMIDHQKKVFPEQDEEGDINIGWDCGQSDAGRISANAGPWMASPC